MPHERYTNRTSRPLGQDILILHHSSQRSHLRGDEYRMIEQNAGTPQGTRLLSLIREAYEGTASVRSKFSSSDSC